MHETGAAIVEMTDRVARKRKVALASAMMTMLLMVITWIRKECSRIIPLATATKEEVAALPLTTMTMDGKVKQSAIVLNFAYMTAEAEAVRDWAVQK